MYESFYSLTEKPFTLLPDPGFLYLSDKHQMALTLLEYGLNDHAGFTVISGEIGAGKTTLIRHMLNQMEHDYTVGLISNTHSSFGELLQWILLAFSVEHRDMSKVEMYQRLVDFIIAEYAQNRRTVLIIDEAQNMDAETLEELRMLSNINADKDQALQVILVGQRELRETLKRPDLIQFAQRITVDYHLEPLSAAETAAYIAHRLQTAGGDPETFTPEACEAIHRYSNGVPRLINLLCDTALVYGYAEQMQRIDERLVTDVAREKQQGGIFPIYAVAGPATGAPATATDTTASTDRAVKAAPAATETPEDSTASTATAIQDAPAETGTPAPERPAQGPVSIELAALTEQHVTDEQPAPQAEKQTRTTGTPVDITAILFRDEQSVQPASEDDEYRWMHGSKKKLRLGICSAEEDSRRYLARLLGSYGFDIIATVPIDPEQLAALDPLTLDVLLVDRDTSHPLPQAAAAVIATWTTPVLYNDSTVTVDSLRRGNPDFGMQLSGRLQSLFDSTGTDTAAIQ